VAGETPEYRNEFRAIKADVVFRPERRTPKPRIVGSINARIDAAGAGDYAEIDDQGRYKVQLPFDISGRKDAKASRYLRMAQPYAGADMGMHFPLHKGTEVILTHVDGDPDRPIIAAAVPNAETTGPVTGGNQTQCAIKTGGGNQIVIEDSDGNQRIKMSTPHGGTVLQLGSPNLPGAGFALQTTLDYFRKIGTNLISVTDGDASHEIKGNETTYNKGTVKSTVVGDKSEFLYGHYSGTVVGSKTEKALAVRTDITVGNMNTLQGGLLTNVQVGLLIELLAVGKYSLGDSKELRKSRIKAAADEKATMANALATIGQLKETVGKQQTKIGSLEVQCASAREQVGDLKQKIGNLEQKVGKFIVHATQITITASRIALHGGGAVVRATGGKVEVIGGGAKIEVGGTVGIRGSVVKLG
jgi:type VI secretion system secreted protein VgrG